MALINYARISTDEQKLALQLDALATRAQVQVFKDRGFSGAQQARPGLQKALRALQADDVLVVWRLDCLGRLLGHLIELLGDLKARGYGHFADHSLLSQACLQRGAEPPERFGDRRSRWGSSPLRSRSRTGGSAASPRTMSRPLWRAPFMNAESSIVGASRRIAATVSTICRCGSIRGRFLLSVIAPCPSRFTRLAACPVW
jgi:hypothetical protein